MSNIPKSLKDAEVVLSDYQGGTESLTLTLEDGDLSYTLPDTAEHILDRGAPGNLIDGNFQPITFSMTVQAKDMSGTAEVQDCRASVTFQEGMPNKFSISGVSYMTADAFMSNINAA